tara:strand:+ start:2429 stop:2629 length:201 start_codon:yes stop_codon:yes gene_type:complete
MRQRRINNLVRMQSSFGTFKKVCLTVSREKEDVGVGKKKDSYVRYLARKVAGVIKKGKEVDQDCSC